MLSKKYLNSIKNLEAIMKKIIEGTAPDNFTTEHLKRIGFSSSNDRAVIGVLKDLNFLSDGGNPTQKYHDYRNSSKSREVLGEALREAYSDIFHINENPSMSDKAAITGLFKSTHNVSKQIAGFMSNTFLCLLGLADISSKPEEAEEAVQDNAETDIVTNTPTPLKETTNYSKIPIVPNLRYNIEIHLPATKDIEVYNAIFKSLKSHLLDD